MVITRALATASIIGALLVGGMALAGPAGAQTADPVAAHAVNPDIVTVIYGPYPSRSICEVEWATVSQNFPPPITEGQCINVSGEWIFAATYDV
jgi:hypothetical protein